MASISFLLLGAIPYNLPEEEVPQNVDLGPAYLSVLCRHFGKLLFLFSIIKAIIKKTRFL